MSEIKENGKNVFKQDSFWVGGKEILYNRPSKSREIPLKSTSNRGFMPSLKPKLKGFIWEYESQLEHDFLLLLDHDPNCIDLQTQPCVIPYTTISGLTKEITPDIWAIFSDGRQFLFEVKPENQYQKMVKDENWKYKMKAIQEYCNRIYGIIKIFN